MRFHVDLDLSCDILSFFLDHLLSQLVERGCGLLQARGTQLAQTVQPQILDADKVNRTKAYADKEHNADDHESEKDRNKNSQYQSLQQTRPALLFTSHITLPV